MECFLCGLNFTFTAFTFVKQVCHGLVVFKHFVHTCAVQLKLIDHCILPNFLYCLNLMLGSRDIHTQKITH